MVRTYILTERERQILRRFLEQGEKLDGFSVLIHSLKKCRGKLHEDFNLIEATMRKIENRGKSG